MGEEDDSVHRTQIWNGGLGLCLGCSRVIKPRLAKQLPVSPRQGGLGLHCTLMNRQRLYNSGADSGQPAIVLICCWP